MKNKDKYKLNELDIQFNHLINGCGKRIEKPIFVNIKSGDTFIVKEKKIENNALKWLLEWLESEIDDR